ncbi:outer membrane protein and related peptidoglycan-associated (lipo)protein [Serpentinimonas maccroryi]|uniref:Peptidoglycan-associated protein n=1 Tax=Serpentinimonas maccroryi TaxID=1458426 RepID=A0A060NK75_9BURK|nr:peptidoglycan-associated lipoprotein Pal [Serpentinimonas maccroryi]BAO82816.1 outer membrane protein and related peptidoglycan-associated (lipo)protein [Serpentinimonas maccroryi]
MFMTIMQSLFGTRFGTLFGTGGKRASLRPRSLTRPLQAAAVLCAALLLAACGSNVNLAEDVPVQDRTAVPVQQIGVAPAAPAGAAAVDQRAVAPVQAGTTAIGQPPAHLARLVFFDFDQYTVRAEFVPLLEGHARFLAADRQRRVALEGHTDERGGREYNLALGQKRAEAVRRSLALMGVQDAQMEAVSFGEEKPASAGSDEAAHSQNRRVELVYR